MKKAIVLVFTMVFILGMSVSSAMAFHTEVPTLWWSVYDSEPDMDNPVANSEPTTEKYMAEGDVLHAYLFLSGIPGPEPGASYFSVRTNWDDTVFDTPGIHISDTWWEPMGQTESTGPPFAASASVPVTFPPTTYLGDDIPLYCITLTATSAIEALGNYDFSWLDVKIKSGSSVYTVDSTTYGLTVNPVPIPGAVLLLGSGLLGLVGIGSRRKRRAA